MQTKQKKQFKALLAEEKRIMWDLKREYFHASDDIDHVWERWWWRNSSLPTATAAKRLQVINNLYRKLGGEPKTLDDYRALLEVNDE